MIEEKVRGFPALLISGPRQSGKTTLARHQFSDSPYRNFEDPIERDFFARDPRAFLDQFARGAVFDEVQNVPLLFSHLLVRIDQAPFDGLRWVLTGSQQIAIREQVQSLTGRLQRLELLPYSYAELERIPGSPRTLAEAVLRGGYPATYDEQRKVNPSDWLSTYTQSVLDRDLRQIVQYRNSNFYRFVELCATMSGQVLNKHKLAQEAQIKDSTADAWIQALEACYIVKLVRPHHRNFKKRITKNPKLYFLDSGLACRLLLISDVNQLRAHPSYGALVETWCFGEVLKSRLNRGLQPSLWFWRSSDGLEVDLVIEVEGGDLLPIEVKSNATPNPDHAHSIRKLRQLSELDPATKIRPGLVIHGGIGEYPAGVDRMIPWNRVDEAMRTLA